MSEVANKDVLDELKVIKKELGDLKSIMADSVLTREDHEALQEYKEQKKSKSLKSHATLKKELGI